MICARVAPMPSEVARQGYLKRLGRGRVAMRQKMKGARMNRAPLAILIDGLITSFQAASLPPG
jgi:hypothetical protein